MMYPSFAGAGNCGSFNLHECNEIVVELSGSMMRIGLCAAFLDSMLAVGNMKLSVAPESSIA